MRRNAESSGTPWRKAGRSPSRAPSTSPQSERKKLDDVIHRYINGDIQVVFEKSDNVMTGYELKTDGHKIAWSIKDYLDSLEEKFYHALYEEAQEKR